MQDAKKESFVYHKRLVFYVQLLYENSK